MCQPHKPNNRNIETEWKGGQTNEKRPTEILKQQTKGTNKITDQNKRNDSLKTSTYQNKRNEQHFRNSLNTSTDQNINSICFVPFVLVCWCFQAVSVFVRSFCFWYVDVFKLFQYLFRSLCFGLLMFSSCFRILFVPFVLVCWCFQAVSEFLSFLLFWSVDVFKLFQEHSFDARSNFSSSNSPLFAIA